MMISALDLAQLLGAYAVTEGFARKLDDVAVFLVASGFEDEVEGRYENVRFSRVGAAVALAHLGEIPTVGGLKKLGSSRKRSCTEFLLNASE